MQEAPDLCRTCGLCCNGMLFDYVPVIDDEVDRLADLGFVVRRSADGSARFDHPCAKFCGECSIYEKRPRSCRSYRCELLRKFDAGEVSFETARRIVDEAIGFMGVAEGHRGADKAHILPMESRRIFENWQSTAPNERTDAENHVVLEQLRVQRFLDLHFRRPDQRRVIERV